MKHGTRGTYVNHRCRCDACKAANSAYTAALRIRVAGHEPPAHGPNGYVNYACRCDVCQAAGSAQSRRQQLARKQAGK